VAQAAAQRLASQAAISVSVDAQDHVWIIHRAASMDAVEAAADEGTSSCKKTPPVLGFVRRATCFATGRERRRVQWPASNHGLTIDHKATSGSAATARPATATS
jgi:hypothetical protein